MPPMRSRNRKDSRRSSLRFPLELPTKLRWKDGEQVHTLHTHTTNMSSSGLYLLAGTQDPPGSIIEFEVKLPAEMTERAGVVLRGKGRLVRRENLAGERVGIAAVIERYQFSLEEPPAEEPTA